MHSRCTLQIVHQPSVACQATGQCNGKLIGHLYSPSLLSWFAYHRWKTQEAAIAMVCWQRSAMEISSYECIGRGGGEIKLGEQDTFTAAVRGRSGSGIGDGPEYWTTGNIDANKNLRLNLGRGITYGDSADSLMISRGGGVPEEARNWPILPGSNGIEGPEPMPAVLVGRGSQVGTHPAVEDRGTPGRDKCVGDVLEDVGGGDNGER